MTTTPPKQIINQLNLKRKLDATAVVYKSANVQTIYAKFIDNFLLEVLGKVLEYTKKTSNCKNIVTVQWYPRNVVQEVRTLRK